MKHQKVLFRTHLKTYREKQKLTLQQVSDSTGLPVPTISRAEKGEDLSLSNAWVLAEFYRLPITVLWSGRKFRGLRQDSEETR